MSFVTAPEPRQPLAIPTFWVKTFGLGMDSSGLVIKISWLLVEATYLPFIARATGLCRHVVFTVVQKGGWLTGVRLALARERKFLDLAYLEDFIPHSCRAM